MASTASMALGDPVFEGVYGLYSIDQRDRREVLGYRLALTAVALAQLGLLVQWRQLGSSNLWPWLIVMAAGLGLALRWIHIYLKPLHRALQLFWLLGCLGFGGLAWAAGPGHMAEALGQQRLWVLAIGPFFAALAGIGFKEFFCFQRPEAIGVTLLLPLALMGYWLGLFAAQVCLGLMGAEAGLLLLLCLRKFPMPAAADVGDKSVFAHLKAQQGIGS
ncbi:DUF2301 domain-containing membrane protein [Cyanobium sp. HWJ4-Hawea]|uniref:DUF2301 domain-containing membrane protein n=1 Tax=Cyanobium sp. HWJ4-Hawea TaxID=2823713 RepID=UPI0020CDB3B6|nr:DUF2301 domain-containing membrane protein [Cyanobium sp. HWJ4-Hawea]